MGQQLNIFLFSVNYSGMDKNILIVGGTGFIGAHFSRLAVASGFNTTVVSYNEPAAKYIIADAQYAQVDITRITDVRAALKGKIFHYVVNLAGYINHSAYFNDGKYIVEAHYTGVKNLIETLNWSEIKRFIQIGSSDEYGRQPAPQNEKIREEPISPYSFSKAAATHFLQMLYRTENFPVTILRLFLVYGPGQDESRFMPQIINGCRADKSFPASEGKQLRDFCHVDDIVEGILMALTNNDVNGQVINLASGIPVTIREVVELVQRKVGYGAPDFGGIAYRPEENMTLYADVSKAKSILGWQPVISLEQGIERLVAGY